jgi:serine/threonine protein kinase
MNRTSWVETRELITAIAERSPGDRERFVREHCSDPALCETLTALVKPRGPGAGWATVPGARFDVPVGSRVGPYIILRRLGAGGMGQVFLGRDPRLDRQVALKCLLASSEAGDDLRDRIVREARPAARIAHPNVATVHDVLEHAERAFTGRLVGARGTGVPHSAPIPRYVRSFSSLNRSSAAGSRVSRDATTPARKPAGMEMMAGLRSGKMASL